MSINNNPEPGKESGSIFFEKKKHEPRPIPTIVHDEPSTDEYGENNDDDSKVAAIVLPIIVALLLLALIGGYFFFNPQASKRNRRHTESTADTTVKVNDRTDETRMFNDTGRPARVLADTNDSDELRPDESALDAALASAGAQSGEITVSLIWYNSDDVDLHILTPGGSEIYYGNRNTGGGSLDVDANAEVMMDMPVENIFFENPSTGEYQVWIEDFTDRNDGYTSYLVRITVGDQSRIFEGHIDGTGTDVDILTFGYDG